MFCIFLLPDFAAGAHIVGPRAISMFVCALDLFHATFGPSIFLKKGGGVGRPLTISLIMSQLVYKYVNRALYIYYV